MLKRPKVPGKDARLPVYSFAAKLKGCSVPLRALIVFEKLSKEDTKSVRIIITNDLKLSLAKVVPTYMHRWGIERAFQELKDTFYFDHYQVRHKKQIMRYWMLCMLMQCTIYAHLSKNRDALLETFADIKSQRLKDMLLYQ